MTKYLYEVLNAIILTHRNIDLEHLKKAFHLFKTNPEASGLCVKKLVSFLYSFYRSNPVPKFRDRDYVSMC